MSDFNINEDAQSGGEYSGSQSPQNGNQNSSQPVESAFPDEDEETITMLDVIEREDKLEEEASAVLGNSDEKNCTYLKGYISRQALYSCATCAETSGVNAAICLACSLECHDNHDVYELYTKRNYRCDCGNEKFGPDFECKLVDKNVKSPLNPSNKYNHNFVGRYCICDKRYPPDEGDDSAESNDEMWQCIVCEDWYHSKHLGAKELPTVFDEFICGGCVEKLDFVHFYKDIDKSGPTNKSAETNDSDTLDRCSKAKEASELNSEMAVASSSKSGLDSKLLSQVTTADSEKTAAICESDTNDSQLENKDPVRKPELTPHSVENECVLDLLKKNHHSALVHCQSSNSSETTPMTKGPLFWPDCNWRSKLCRCRKCMEIYKKKECEYLLDDKDTVQYYEAQGKAIAKDNGTPLERGMSALNRMNRAAVVEALHGYDELKADLSVYLRKFADSKKVVREEDIHEFFQQLKSKKRPRLESL